MTDAKDLEPGDYVVVLRRGMYKEKHATVDDIQFESTYYKGRHVWQTIVYVKVFPTGDRLALDPTEVAKL